MPVSLKEFEKTLAENKVYDAWQYVESLRETLGYMSVSYEMLLKVHEHRVSTLKSVENEIIHKAMETGKGTCKVSDLEKTNLNIGGYVLDDAVFLRKTAMEFFHYGRMSMDVLWIGYTKLYRKDKVMVYFQGGKGRRKPWQKDERGGPSAKNRRSNWWSCSITASPEARLSVSTT